MSRDITVHELKKILSTDQNKNLILVDVRMPAEHKEMNIEGAKNIPLNELDKVKKDLERFDTVIVHCRTGGRSQKACDLLKDLKHPSVLNVRGGILEWESEGFAVNKKKGFHLPLIQQVHTVAGSLILVGVILSFFVTQSWILLSGLVGAGLLFAGLTGWCGMAKLLGIMPWNK